MSDLTEVRDRIASLCRHVEALKVSTERLASRVVAWDDDQPPTAPTHWGTIAERLLHKDETPTIATLLRVVREADRRIAGAERDIAATRSKIDQVLSGDYLQDDLRPHFRAEGGE